MTDFAIKVEELSKRYRIGAKKRRDKSFASAAANALSYPLHNLQRLRELTSFGEHRQNGRAASDIIWALKDVSFEVKQGEALGVIGRNGSGKSTLLKVLSRITEPTEGRVLVRGSVASLLEVGTGFHPELTGRDNVYLNGAILGMTKRDIDRRFDEIVAFSGVEQFIDTPVKRYSSGMKVRLAFAVAAHVEPDILIIDEVLAVGDAEFQEKCLGKMESVTGEGRTVVFVSHDLDAVQRFCSRVLLLADGAVACDDAPSKAVAKYMETSQAMRRYSRYDADGNSTPSEEGIQVVRARVTSGGEFRPEGVPSGSPLEFEVTCLVPKQIQLPDFAIGIDTLTGHRVARFFSGTGNLNGAAGRVGPGEFTYRCVVPDLKLVPDDYLVTLNAMRHGASLAKVEHALTIKVLDRQFSKRAGVRDGVVRADETWEIPGGLPVLARQGQRD